MLQLQFSVFNSFIWRLQLFLLRLFMLKLFVSVVFVVINILLLVCFRYIVQWLVQFDFFSLNDMLLFVLLGYVGLVVFMIDVIGIGLQFVYSGLVMDIILFVLMFFVIVRWYFLLFCSVLWVIVMFVFVMFMQFSIGLFVLFFMFIVYVMLGFLLIGDYFKVIELLQLQLYVYGILQLLFIVQFFFFMFSVMYFVELFVVILEFSFVVLA